MEVAAISRRLPRSRGDCGDLAQTAGDLVEIAAVSRRSPRPRGGGRVLAENVMTFGVFGRKREAA
jgi:hypothetical protein